MLAALDPDQHPHWAVLIGRAQLQLAGLPEHGGQLGGPNHPATSIADARTRFPGAALERWVRVRDRCCVGPVCTRPAHSAEIDHTRDWYYDGLTVASNLGPPCAHCHRLKHAGGWTLAQPEPGRFQWRSPLGAVHTVVARRVLETPLDPAPRPDRQRPVLGVRRPPGPDHPGWVEKQSRRLVPDEVPTPPETRTTSRYPDEPPF